jgi:hypothetical protein
MTPPVQTPHRYTIRWSREEFSSYTSLLPSNYCLAPAGCKDRPVLTPGDQAHNGGFDTHPGNCGIDPLHDGPNLEKIRPEARYPCTLKVVAYLKRYIPLKQVVSGIQRGLSCEACSHKSSRIIRVDLACASIRTVSQAGKAVGK